MFTFEGHLAFSGHLIQILFFDSVFKNLNMNRYKYITFFRFSKMNMVFHKKNICSTPEPKFCDFELTFEIQNKCYCCSIFVFRFQNLPNKYITCTYKDRTIENFILNY